MKYFVLTLLILSLLTPAFAELDQDDLNKIRLIVKEEIEKESTKTNQKIDKLDTKIDGLDTRIQQVEKDVAFTKGKLDDVDRSINLIITFIVALIALIIAAVGIPQIIIAWRTRTPNGQDKQIEVLTNNIETLTQRIEALENGRIQTP